MKNIVIQGLGYVGLAIMTFCAGAKKKDKYLYNVVGIEKNVLLFLNQIAWKQSACGLTQT